MDISKHAIARLKSRFSFGYADIQNIFSILNNSRAYTLMTHKKGGKHIRFNYKGKCIIAVINNGMIVTFKFMDKLYEKKKKEKKMRVEIYEKAMTIKEVSKALNVSVELITKRVRELFPNKMKKGVATYLTEQEVSAISVRIKENSSLIPTSYDRTKLPKTDLEKEMMIQQAMRYQQEKIEELSIKAQVADEISNSCGLYLPSLVGKMIMGRPNLFCQWLVDERIMYRKGSSSLLVPMSPYDQKEKDYFKIKTSVIKGKSTVTQTYFTPKGLCWIQVRYLKKTGMLSLDYSVNVLEV